MEEIRLNIFNRPSAKNTYNLKTKSPTALYEAEKKGNMKHIANVTVCYSVSYFVYDEVTYVWTDVILNFLSNNCIHIQVQIGFRKHFWCSQNSILTHLCRFFQ